MFNGEAQKGEEEEAWLLGMMKHFKIYKYFDQLKARMEIYNLTEKYDIWWKDIKRVKNNKEKYFTWRFLKIILKESFYLDSNMRKEPSSSMN